MTRKFEIEWLSDEPSITEEEWVIINREIDYISESLEKASDLIFHTISLTGSYDENIIIVDGKDDVDNTLFLTYYETSKWITFDDIGGEDVL
jgi:hypothetical protein